MKEWWSNGKEKNHIKSKHSYSKTGKLFTQEKQKELTCQNSSSRFKTDNTDNQTVHETVKEITSINFIYDQ